MKPRKITIYDTTLRDGNQSVGIGLSLSDKLILAEHLSDLGLHYIEGGWPTSAGSVDMQFFHEARRMRLRSRLAVFGSTRRKGTTCGKDPLIKLLVKSDTPVATLFGKCWSLHVKKVIKTTLAENLDMIAESVAYMKKRVDEVIFDAEHFFDGYRENPAYALECLNAAIQAGADCVVLCDTNGGILPGDFRATFREVAGAVFAPLGVHTHNDTGCADANTFLAVEEGAVHVQGTINGLGERCGNANLCTVIPGLQLKQGYRLIPPENLAKLTGASVFVSEIVNVSHNIRQPYVGESAFSHKAGTHTDGVQKTTKSFEHIDPAKVGNLRHFVLSAQAGTSTILARLAAIEPGLSKSDPFVKKLLKRIVDMEAMGYQFEAADGTFELTVREMLGMFKEPFTVKGFRVIEEKNEDAEVFSEATIKVEENGVLEHTAAEGDGPVNALDNALRKALTKFFPSLAQVKLEDYKVRVLGGSDGTEAKVRVLIESSDGNDRWGTVGVSTNIIEASWIALIDSLKYKLMKDARKGKSR